MSEFMQPEGANGEGGLCFLWMCDQSEYVHVFSMGHVQNLCL